MLGVKIGRTYKAYPFSELEKAARPVKENISGQLIEVIFDRENNTARALDEQGMDINTVMAYWFAWVAFHPETEVFQAAD